MLASVSAVPGPAGAQLAEGGPALAGETAPAPRRKRPPRPAKAAKPGHDASAEVPAPVLPAAGPVEPPPPPNLTTLCEGGSAARYAAEAGVAIWVTRSGAIAVENPLRPLTPETTRVLQVVLGDRAATAYGPDLAALRRGGTPAALAANLGGEIRWDAVLTLLPDTLTIVSEAGQTLARLPFRGCGEAPAVKAPAAKAVPKPRKPPRPGGEAAQPQMPKGLTLPQGAIPSTP